MRKETIVAAGLSLESLQQATELRQQIDTRMGEIDEMNARLERILSGESAGPAQRVQRGGKANGKDGDKTAGGRTRNEMTLKEAIIRTLGRRTMDINEVLDGVLKLGYKFNSQRPVNSVGAYLYSANGKKFFRNDGGRFSVIQQPQQNNKRK